MQARRFVHALKSIPHPLADLAAVKKGVKGLLDICKNGAPRAAGSVGAACPPSLLTLPSPSLTCVCRGQPGHGCGRGRGGGGCPAAERPEWRGHAGDGSAAQVGTGGGVGGLATGAWIRHAAAALAALGGRQEAGAMPAAFMPCTHIACC